MIEINDYGGSPTDAENSSNSAIAISTREYGMSASNDQCRNNPVNSANNISCSYNIKKRKLLKSVDGNYGDSNNAENASSSTDETTKENNKLLGLAEVALESEIKN